MTQFESLLRQVAACLDNAERPWALVGGLAVSVRTEPRFTRDIDIAISVAGDPDAENVIREMTARGFRTTAVVEQTRVHRMATVRLAQPRGPEAGLLVDILFASSGIEPEVCAAAEPMEVFAGLVVPVASVAHLLALKVLARDDRSRPQDAADIRQLSRVLTPSDLAAAYDACRLIESRGFHRGRDLKALLDQALQDAGV